MGRGEVILRAALVKWEKMGDEPTICRATIGDLADLVALRVALFRAMGDPQADNAGLAEALAHYFSAELPAGRFHAWLARDSAGTAIGCGGLVFAQKPPSPANHSGREAYLMNMYTVPAWRGRGIAGRILAAILAFARDAGAGAVRLHATEPGRPIYERNGFAAVGTEMLLTLN